MNPYDLNDVATTLRERDARIKAEITALEKELKRHKGDSPYDLGSPSARIRMQIAILTSRLSRH